MILWRGGPATRIHIQCSELAGATLGRSIAKLLVLFIVVLEIVYLPDQPVALARNQGERRNT
jgi:hypothetical protein